VILKFTNTLFPSKTIVHTWEFIHQNHLTILSVTDLMKCPQFMISRFYFIFAQVFKSTHGSRILQRLRNNLKKYCRIHVLYILFIGYFFKILGHSLFVIHVHVLIINFDQGDMNISMGIVVLHVFKMLHVFCFITNPSVNLILGFTWQLIMFVYFSF